MTRYILLFALALTACGGEPLTKAEAQCFELDTSRQEAAARCGQAIEPSSCDVVTTWTTGDLDCCAQHFSTVPCHLFGLIQPACCTP